MVGSSWQLTLRQERCATSKLTEIQSPELLIPTFVTTQTCWSDDQFERSVAQVVAAFPILNRRLLKTDSDSFALVEGTLANHVVRLDLHSESQSDAREAATELWRETRMPIGHAMSKVYLWNVAVDRSAILWITDHIICDAWSTSILFNELASVILDRPRTRRSTRFGEYAEIERAWLAGSEAAKQIDDWKLIFEDFPRRPTPKFRSQKSDRRHDVLTLEQIAAFTAICAKLGLTLFNVVFACFGQAVRTAFGREVYISINTSGREDHLTVGQVGCFINSLMIPIIRPRGDLVGTIREQAIVSARVLGLKRLPCEKVLDLTSTQHPSELSDAFFAFKNIPYPKTILPDSIYADVAVREPRLPIEYHWIVNRQGGIGELIWSSDVLGRSLAEDIARDTFSVLARLAQ